MNWIALKDELPPHTGLDNLLIRDSQKEYWRAQFDPTTTRYSSRFIVCGLAERDEGGRYMYGDRKSKKKPIVTHWMIIDEPKKK